MAVQIKQKIKGYQVVDTTKPKAEPVAAPATPEPKTAEIVQMHEKLARPEVLLGSTYKIKSPLFEHAIYVTINDIVLNPGTEYEVRRPFEVFVNSKNMDHFQWIVALTRIMSAVFRKGGDCTFLVEELKAVFDPRGGYWKPGGVFIPSLVADLGNILEVHLKAIGLIKAPELSDAQKQLIADKRAALESEKSAKAAAPASVDKPAARASNEDTAISQGEIEAQFPPEAQVCGKCSTKALVSLDGCQTCLNCGYSKCG